MRTAHSTNRSAFRRFAVWIWIAAAVAHFGAATAQDEPAEDVAAEANADPKEAAQGPRGRLVRITLPITGNVDRRVMQQIRRAISEIKPSGDAVADDQKPTLVFEFSPGQSEFGGGSEFEDSYKLAKYLVSRELDGVRTVAFIPRSIKGHGVLVAIACQQIIMADDAEIGDAGADHDEDHPIDATMMVAYEQIARSRATVPAKLALAMLDAQRELLRVETETGPELVFKDELGDLQKTKTIDEEKTEVIFGEGQPGVLTGPKARDMGVAAFLSGDRDEVAQHLGLSRKAMKVDPFLEDELRGKRVNLIGFIDPRMAQTRLGMIGRAVDNDRVNFVCLWIESSGGDVESAKELASYLANLKSEDVLTVAYVPTEARGLAALVALSCDDLIMHPSAEIGGGQEGLSDAEIADLLDVIKEELAPSKSRSRSLMSAMIKPDLEVHKYKNQKNGLVQYFSEAEFQEQEDKDDWQRGVRVTEPGKAFDGREAEDLDLAYAVVEGFDELKKEYGMEGDPELAEPTWVDDLVRALANPAIASILVMIGMAGVYIEVQMPGIGLGGFVAAFAFTLYFWANFLDGTATSFEIVLFLVGIACLVLEIFIIPGFGIFGLGGGAMILVSLVLASQTFIMPSSDADVTQLRDSLLIVGCAIVGFVGIAAVLRKYLPSAPVFNRLLLEESNPDIAEQRADRESMAHYEHLIGTTGVTTTQLTPSGKARLDDELVDVISNGDLIPMDAKVEVVEVHGNRVIVQSVVSDS
jgi:membrane-bound ClpP family serine protease